MFQAGAVLDSSLFLLQLLIPALVSAEGVKFGVAIAFNGFTSPEDVVVRGLPYLDPVDAAGEPAVLLTGLDDRFGPRTR